MSHLTPQEKKRLSYAHDRRNTYGQNSEASRKAIPLRKKKARRSYRKATNQILPKNIEASVASDGDLLESRIQSVASDPWRKAADTPLGEVVQQKKEKRVGRYRRKTNKVLVPEVPGAFFNVPNVVDHEGILRGTKKK